MDHDGCLDNAILSNTGSVASNGAAKWITELPWPLQMDCLTFNRFDIANRHRQAFEFTAVVSYTQENTAVNIAQNTLWEQTLKSAIARGS